MAGNFLANIETIRIRGSQNGAYEQFYLLRKNAVWSIESEAELIATFFTLVSCMAYFSNLKMEATCSTEIFDYSSQLLSASVQKNCAELYKIRDYSPLLLAHHDHLTNSLFFIFNTLFYSACCSSNRHQECIMTYGL
jgi:hypothetical protein